MCLYGNLINTLHGQGVLTTLKNFNHFFGAKRFKTIYIVYINK